VATSADKNTGRSFFYILFFRNCHSP